MNNQLSRILPAVSLFTLSLMAWPAQNAHAVSTDVVISQVYGGGGNAGATYTHDFIELFNRGTSSVSLTGWSLQYASATGTGNFGSSTTQLTELPNVSLAPGQYLLVQEATGGAVGAAIPTPDFIDATPISMGSTAGKVALVTSATGLGCNGGSTTCSAAQLALIKDLVGYGTANFFEGAAAPATANATASVRAANGCTDTDNNSTDFATQTPTPRNTSTSLNLCVVVVENAPTVSSTVPADGTVGVLAGANLTVNFSEPVNVAGSWYNISCNVSGSKTAVVSGGPSSFSLNPNTDFEFGESCTVTIYAAQVSDQDASDPPDNMAANFVFSFDTLELVRIHEVQGAGASSPMAGNTVLIEGIVVGDFQDGFSGTNGDLNGFHVQEEDIDADADPLTSEGIFVFNGSSPAVNVQIGDLVQVIGAVSEFNGMTQITSFTGVTVVSSGNALPAATQLSLPVAAVSDFEAVEGMYVTFPQALVIAEYFNFDRFNEIVLTSERRLTPTAEFLPGSAEATQAAADFLLDKITLDDGRSVQNPDPAIHPDGGVFDLNNLFRGGDTVADVTGVMDFSFSLYRVHPTQGADYTSVNPRSAEPDEVGGIFKVASFNVLNYFTTLDSGPDICGPAQNQECRGADDANEFTRQRDKIIAALTAIDAAVVGLIEIENNVNDDAVIDLVAGLNAVNGAGTYDYVSTGTIGTDAIKLAFIYQPAAVTPSGAHAILDSSVDPDFLDTKNRPALAQTFADTASGGVLTVAVNHFKSKGSNCNDVFDFDLGDGAGNCNLTRTAAAQALADWLATDPTGSGDTDVLIIGDLNSYDKEDPIAVLDAAAYTDLAFIFGGESAYGYVFDGQIGYLDYALASPTLFDQVSGVTDWHINADEPDLIDYDTSFKLPAQEAIYAPDPYRSSDHDPVIVGMDLLNYDFSGFFKPIKNLPEVNSAKAGNRVPL